MSASQLTQEIERIEQRRAQISQQEANFQQGRQNEVQQQFAQNRATQQAYVHDHTQFGAASYSPYHSSSSSSVANPPLNDRTETGPHMGYYMNSWGGVGIMFNPSSW
jgi:hypothetical protein